MSRDTQFEGKAISRTFKYVTEACRFQGYRGELVFVEEDCSLRIHDGCTCGGKILNKPGITPAEVKAIVEECLAPLEEDIAEIEACLETLSVSSTANSLTVSYKGENFTLTDTDTDTDTDTAGTSVDNGDGTTTITFPDGTTALVSNDLVDDDNDISLGNEPSSTTVNDDGSTTVCYPYIDNVAGTETGEEFCITFPAPPPANTSQVSFDLESDITHNAGDGSDPVVIPIAADLFCNYLNLIAEPNGLVTDKYVQDYTVRGAAWSSGVVGPYSNPCDNIVTSSVLATAGPTRASAFSSNQTTATGTQASTLSATFADATGTGNAIIASTGAPATRAVTSQFYSSMLSTRVAANNVLTGAAPINSQGWSSTIATANPVIGQDTAALYSYILGGGDNWAEFNYSGVISSNRTKSNAVRAVSIATNDSINEGATSLLLASEFVINPDLFSVVGGMGAGAPSTANRTWRINSLTGDAFFAGAVTTGAVFAGFGECVLGEFDAGTFVRFTAGNNAEEVKTREEADAIVIGRTPAVCAGGIFDPANAPYEYDDAGAPIMVQIESDEDVVAAKELLALAEESLKELDAAEKDVREIYAAPLEEDEKENSGQAENKAKAKPELTSEGLAKMAGIEKLREQTIAFKAKAEKQAKEAKAVTREIMKANPKFDAEKHKTTKFSGVEMSGRPLVPNPEKLKVGDYYGNRGVKSDAANGYRVIDVVGNSVQIVVK